jgi:hypothetical protein
LEPDRSVSLGFLLMGMFNNFTYVLALTAAKDLLPPDSLVSVVLLCADVPARRFHQSHNPETTTRNHTPQPRH